MVSAHYVLCPRLLACSPHLSPGPGLEAEPDRGLPKAQPSTGQASESHPEVDLPCKVVELEVGEIPGGCAPGKQGLA